MSEVFMASVSLLYSIVHQGYFALRLVTSGARNSTARTLPAVAVDDNPA